MSTKIIGIKSTVFFLLTFPERNEKMRFDPCEIPKDGLTEGIVTRLATIAVV